MIKFYFSLFHLEEMFSKRDHNNQFDYYKEDTQIQELSAHIENYFDFYFS